MQIHGLNKTTLLDYPEHVAATLFCGGCNFRCPFCHNSDLVLNPDCQPRIPEEEIIDFLKKRKNVLSGVCITGGEPTLQKDLEIFISRIKEMDYLVKLDTNGYCPETLEKLVDKQLLDYIAMDIKSGMTGYAAATGIDNLKIERIKTSIDFIKHCGVQYEFRTTVVKGLHTREDFTEIGPMIQGGKAYFLQQFKDNENVMIPGYQSFSREEMEEFAKIVRSYVKQVKLRGMD